MLIMSPINVIALGAHHRGHLETVQFQKGWSNGSSIVYSPSRLYLCSAKFFNCLADKTSIISLLKDLIVFQKKYITPPSKTTIENHQHKSKVKGEKSKKVIENLFLRTSQHTGFL